MITNSIINSITTSKEWVNMLISKALKKVAKDNKIKIAKRHDTLVTIAKILL